MNLKGTVRLVKGGCGRLSGARAAAMRKWRGLPMLAAAVAAVWLLFPMKKPFPDAYSRLVFDRNGMLLRATLAPDEQLRFPPSTDPPPRKYAAAVFAWEDRRFYRHPGIDPLAIAGAFAANLRGGGRMRGGSTITMQLVRLARPNRRTYVRKLLECAAALRYSIHLSKERQLRLYAAHVPMGGNVVGIESAAWRYFGMPAKELTWAQAALFAVLPNAPSSINIEKQRGRLGEKRDRLLAMLLQEGCFDSLTYTSARAERLPDPLSRLPSHAPHFCRYALNRSRETAVATTLDLDLQRRSLDIIAPFKERLNRLGIRNCAVLIAETQTGAVRAYIGSQSFYDSAGSGQVDGIQACRSPGSLLKPFLVACALDGGLCTMNTLLHDVPTWYGNFAPMNASRSCSGVTTVHQMLVQSLNIPAVRLLHAYGVEDFYVFLKDRAGLGNLFRTSGGYGLTLVLGGLEVRLWELCAMFSALANGGTGNGLSIEPNGTAGQPRRLCSEGAAWLVLETLNDVKRPEAEYYRHLFGEQAPVAWKTGTSYGQKDAWAIGCNAQWTIGVWAGNFSGEGNALIGGAQSAGPMLFSLFRNLTDGRKPVWFTRPEFDLKPTVVCALSGLPPNDYCPERDTVFMPSAAALAKKCPLHRLQYLSRSGGYEVCSRCWNADDTVRRVVAVYDPSITAVLRQRGKRLDTLARHNPRCSAAAGAAQVSIEYPTGGLHLQVPRDYSGAFEKVVMKAASQRQGGRLFWFIDGRYLGETVDRHAMAVDLPQGRYRLTVQDEEGASSSVRFKVFRRGDGGVGEAGGER